MLNFHTKYMCLCVCPMVCINEQSQIAVKALISRYTTVANVKVAVVPKKYET